MLRFLPVGRRSLTVSLPVSCSVIATGTGRVGDAASVARSQRRLKTAAAAIAAQQVQIVRLQKLSL